RIRRYVAVDDTNRDRLACEEGIAAERIRVVLNAVDLARFAPRPPLPATPRRALLFSNYAADDTHAGAVREACRRAGVALDVVGAAAGTSSDTPEVLLAAYDLVFAKGRCALEALAVGAAVVLVDYAGAGPLVTSPELDRLRRLNFGRRLLRAPLDPARLVAEIARYDAADAAEVSRRIRATASLEQQLDALVALYREAIAEQDAQVPDLAAEERAAGAYLRQWGARVRDGALRDACDAARAALDRTVAARDQLQRDHERTAVEAAGLGAELARTRAALQATAGERDRLATDLGGVVTERDRLRDELGWMTRSATWRLREALLRSRLLVAVYRRLRR